MRPKVVEMRLMPLLMQLRYLLGAGLLCFVLASCGLYMWEQTPLNTDTQPSLGRTFGYTGSGVAGLILFVSCASFAVVLLCESSQLFVRYAYLPYHSHADAARLLHMAVGLQLLLGLFFVVVATVLLMVWGRDPLRCGVIFCLGAANYPTPAKTKGASFNVLISYMLFSTMAPSGCLVVYRVWTLWQLQKATKAVREAVGDTTRPITPDHGTSNDGELEDVMVPADQHRLTSGGRTGAQPGSSPANPMAKPMSMQPYHATPWKQQLSRIIGVCAGIIACAVLTFWLPNDPRRFHSSTIAAYTNLTIRRDTTTSTGVVPDMPDAYFRTGQVRVSDSLVLKLFPGNVFFYVYLLATALIVFVLRQTQTGRYWMQRRIPQCASFTYGEAAFVAATALLVGCFAMYGLHDHNYKQLWNVGAADSAQIRPSERWGRGLGQLAILFLSLLLLPVGRQSVVVSVLGVSRDGLLWFHRAVGYAMLAAAVAHATAFYVSFHEQGLLWHNLNFLPITVGQKGVKNDFSTLAATWTTWFLLIAMGIFGLNYMRRRYYELFYYTHLAATYMTLPVMVFHAAAGWMYLLPGMTIFLADHLVRIWQRSAVVKVVHARVISEDTTELAFTVPGRWDMRRVHPGQYVLVCVPELSALQWHPFTLTSVIDEEAACARTTVFHVHIKSMGPKTWTGRLYDLARTGQTFSVAVEGPCGTPVDYRRYDDIVLVAGGIGAAPCVSVYGSLLREHVRGAGGVPRVRLVWSTRSASLVGAVADMLLLPAPYRDLVCQGSVEGSTSGHRTVSSVEVNTPLSHPSGLVDVPDAFTCNIFVTRTVEYARCAAVYAESSELSLSEEARESRETRVNDRMNTSSLVNRGGRVFVHEGRPDVKREVKLALTDPVTETVSGDVRRKLVLVCGPMSLVEETAEVAARLGVVVHTEEFLF